MAATLSTLTTRILRIFPDAGAAGSVTAIEDAINEAHRLIVQRMPGLARRREDINVTASTQAYNLPADTCQVEEVYWVTSTSAAAQLQYLDRKALHENKFTTSNQPWPVEGTANPPTHYSLLNELASGVQSNLQIQLHPTPSVSTSGGFPILYVYLSEVKTLTTSDTIPEGLSADELYKTGALAILSEGLNGPSDPDTQTYWQKFWSLFQSEEQRWRGLHGSVEVASTFPRQGKA